MALSNSPGIVTNGLIFAFDMYNIKSYRGEPTTNLFYNHSTYLAASSNWTNSGAWTASDNETDVSLPDIVGLAGAPNLRILSGVITTASNQGCQFGSAVVTVSPSTTYTMSCYYMQSRAMANNAFPYLRTNVNNNSIASFSYNGNTNQAQWPVGKWIRITATGTTQSNENGIYLSQYFGEQVNDKIWMCCFQVEAKSYATPLVAGTRSDTQVIKDQTGNSTVTANLTYGSDNTFIINGSPNRLQIPVSGNPSMYSMEVAIRNYKAITSNTDMSPYYSAIGFTANGYSTIGLNLGEWTGSLSNETLSFWHYGAAQGAVSISDTIGADWNIYTINWNGSTYDIWVNGVKRTISSSFGTLNLITNLTKISVGYNEGWNYWFNGRIGALKIYNTQLTDNQVKSNYNALKERFFGYQPLVLVNSGNITLTNNGTTSVTITKNSDNGSWNGQAYSAEYYSAPCTIEFSKTADVSDNGSSYAMIGWNADPTTDSSYSSIDYAAYPYRQDAYVVYNNGSQVHYGGAWDPNKRFYIVYDTDGYIRHYNGSTLLYSVNYGTNNKVTVDSSLYNTNTTYCKFSDVRVCRKSWNGTQYV